MQLYLDCCCWAKKAFSITFHSSIFGSGQFLLCSIVHWMIYYWTRASTAKLFWKQSKKSGKMSKMVLYANGFLGKFGYYCTLMYARDHNLSFSGKDGVDFKDQSLCQAEWWVMAVLHTKAIFSKEAFVKELPRREGKERWRAITSKARTTNAINNNRKDFCYLFWPEEIVKCSSKKVSTLIAKT